jgi:hypothetical protein
LVGSQLFADFRFSQGVLEPNPSEKRGLGVSTLSVFLFSVLPLMVVPQSTETCRVKKWHLLLRFYWNLCTCWCVYMYFFRVRCIFFSIFSLLSLFPPSFCKAWVSNPRSFSLYLAARDLICRLCIYYKNCTII